MSVARVVRAVGHIPSVVQNNQKVAPQLLREGMQRAVRRKQIALIDAVSLAHTAVLRRIARIPFPLRSPGAKIIARIKNLFFRNQIHRFSSLFSFVGSGTGAPSSAADTSVSPQ